MFWDFLMLCQIFLSTQVKQHIIFSNKNGIYELLHISIVFQNLSDYDAHLFIKEARGKNFNKDDIIVIAENKDKYNGFDVNSQVTGGD